MRLAQIGAKPQIVATQVKNADTITLQPGMPVFLAANGTDDGLAVLSASAATAANNPLLAMGIVGQSVAASSVGDAIVWGLVLNARITLQTRSASTAAFASWPAIAIGDLLGPESVNNGLTRVTAGAASFTVASTNNGTYSYLPVGYIAMQTVASGTTQASSYSSSAYQTGVSALYLNGKVFVRLM